MTDFLWDAGTSGFIVAPFDLLTTELNSLADGSGATSSVGGTSGVFQQSNYGSAIQGIIGFFPGASFTPASGSPALLGWFLGSAGSGFEAVVANTDLPRAPDFVIPFIGSNAYGAFAFLSAGPPVMLPPWGHKIFVMNHTGTALPSSSNQLVVGPNAVKY